MGRAAVLLHPVTLLIIHQWCIHPKGKKYHHLNKSLRIMKTLLKDNRSSVKTQCIISHSEQLPMTEFSLTLLGVGIVNIPGYSTMTYIFHHLYRYTGLSKKMDGI